MDDRPRQVLKQLLAQYGPALCDQPGRCRGLLLDTMQGACAAEVNTLLLILQYGIVQDLRAAVGTQPPALLLPQLVQKLHTQVPLDETAIRWAVEVRAEVLGLRLPAPPFSPPSPPPPPQPVVSGPPRPFTSPETWRNNLGMEFVLIPAGMFQMGSPLGMPYDDEKPVHTVRLTQPFYLGKYEVTQGQWQAVMGHNPSWYTGDPALPVNYVSWEDVQEFIRQMNARAPGTASYRLPTEAEWEYAARAGSTTAYSFRNSHELWRYAWYSDNAGAKPHPVGQLQPNAWGLYDMYGNVWEWVQDWYAAYLRGTAVDPTGPLSGSDRVCRGCYFGADRCRSAARYHSTPGIRHDFVGLRLLRQVS